MKKRLINQIACMSVGGSGAAGLLLSAWLLWMAYSHESLTISFRAFATIVIVGLPTALVILAISLITMFTTNTRVAKG